MSKKACSLQRCQRACEPFSPRLSTALPLLRFLYTDLHERKQRNGLLRYTGRSIPDERGDCGVKKLQCAKTKIYEEESVPGYLSILFGRRQSQGGDLGDAFIDYTYPLCPVLEVDGERCRGHASPPPAIDPPPWPPSKVPTRKGLELAVAKLTCETAKRLVSLRPSPKSIGANFRSKREDGDSLILRTTLKKNTKHEKRVNGVAYYAAHFGGKKNSRPNPDGSTNT